MLPGNKLLIIAATVTLTACGGNNDSSSTNNGAGHPVFKWTDASVSNTYSPLGSGTNRTPTFSWPAYTDAGLRATEYNFGFESTSGGAWTEYTVSASAAKCTTGNICQYKPSITLNIGDQKVWWVRGKINGQWKEWSSPHVFKIVATPPGGGGGAYKPSGNTTTHPTFEWPRVGTNSNYELGMETWTGNNWQSFTARCTTSTCSYTPNANLSVGDIMTWWVRPAGGAWSDAVNFNVTKNSGGGGGGGTTENISWSPINGATKYDLGMERTNGSNWQSITKTPAQLKCQSGTCSTAPHSSFRVGDRVNWWVRAYVNGRWQGWSAKHTTTIKKGGNTGGDTQAPTKPSNLHKVSATATRVVIQWNASTDNVAVKGYRVYRNGTQIGTVTGTRFTDNSVIGSTTYSYKVSAYDAANNVSPISTAVSIKTPKPVDTQAPTKPANVRKVSAVHNRVVIAWNASTDNVAVRGYRIYRNGTQMGTSTSTTFSDTTVKPNKTYSYTVRAYDAANNLSAVSTALSVVTPAAPDTQAPTKPANVRKVSAVHNRVVIAWNASTDNVAVRGYRIYRNGTQMGTSTSTTFSDTTVKPNKTYSYTVRAYDAANNLSAVSTALAVVTPAAPDTQAPTAPASLVKNKVKAGSVSMKWNAATDNRAVTGYKVYRNGVLIKTLAVVLKYKDKTVSPATRYTYTVKAFDAANNLSAASNALVVTTPSLGRTDIVEPGGIYNTPLDVLNVTLKILPRTGTTCTTDHYQGCTFGNVLKDINWRDKFKPEVKAVFTTAEGFTANATIRQRGGYTRLNPMKSFRVKLDKNGPKWHGERRIQLIKTFDDPLRVKHKMSYDLFTEINKLPSMRARYVHLKVQDKGSFNFAENPSYTILPNYKTTDMGLYLQVEYFGKDYLARRNWMADSRIYKPDHFDFKWHAAAYALDAKGKPVNLDAFEAQLEIKSGKDHRAFVEMIQAVNNTSNDFSQVFNTYFDRENYLNWLAVNILSNNNDTVQHNFYLYNPKGTKKFYWIPWDYDYAYNIDVTDAAGNIVNTGPKPPFWYTHGFRWDHPMHRRFLKIPGNAAALKAKVIELRNTVFTDSNIRAKLNSYSAIKPLVTNQPDNLWQYYWQPTQAGRNAEFDRRVNELVANVAFNYSKFIEYYDNPMPFFIEFAHQQSGMFSAGWEPSVSLAGHAIKYDIVISRTTDFKPADIVRTIRNLTGTRYSAQLNIPRGKYYVKVVSRDTTNPQVRWQSASNEFTVMPLNYNKFGFVEMNIR